MSKSIIKNKIKFKSRLIDYINKTVSKIITFIYIKWFHYTVCKEVINIGKKGKNNTFENYKKSIQPVLYLNSNIPVAPYKTKEKIKPKPKDVVNIKTDSKDVKEPDFKEVKSEYLKKQKPKKKIKK